MNLQQLMQQNRVSTPKNLIEIHGNEATIYLYDVIGADMFGGISAQALVPQISALKVATIHLRINSPGGDVFDARAIVTELNNASATTIAHIDGLAASAATYIATACDQVKMAEGAFFMVHNAWTMAVGNANDLEQVGNLLRKVDDSIKTDYAQKTGKTREEITQWMDAETWFSAEEALAAGFVDEIIPSQPRPAAQWNLSAYANAPRQLIAPEAPSGLTPEEHHALLSARLSLLEKLAA